MTLQELGIVVLSALLHASWSVAIKGSRDPLAFNALQIVPQVLIGAALVSQVEWSEVPLGAAWILMASGATHALYMYWMSRAYETADLSLVYPIARSTPAFLPLVAMPLLGETITPLGGVGIAIVVAGMWGVHAGPDFRWRSLLERGSRFAYLTLAATVAYGLLDKSAMARLEGVSWTGALPRSLFYYFVLEATFGTLFVALGWSRLRKADLRGLVRGEWRQIAVASLFTFASYGLILEALRTAQASYVVAVRQVSVLFVLAMSIALLGEKPTRLRMVGAAATVVGVGVVGLAG